MIFLLVVVKRLMLSATFLVYRDVDSPYKSGAGDSNGAGQEPSPRIACTGRAAPNGNSAAPARTPANRKLASTAVRILFMGFKPPDRYDVA
jgi:hypothetical protein